MKTRPDASKQYVVNNLIFHKSNDKNQKESEAKSLLSQEKLAQIFNFFENKIGSYKYGENYKSFSLCFSSSNTSKDYTARMYKDNGQKCSIYFYSYPSDYGYIGVISKTQTCIYLDLDQTYEYVTIFLERNVIPSLWKELVDNLHFEEIGN